MLSYEKSREMKELGHPQELKDGDWFYVVGSTKQTHLVTARTSGIDGSAWGAVDLEPSDYVKVPTTDGMWDGLAKYIDKVDLTYVGVTYIEYSPQLGSLVTRTIQVKGKTADALEQALCELWKKVFGAKQEE